MVNVTQLERRVAHLEQQLAMKTQALAEYTTLANVQANGFDQANVAADEQGAIQRPVRRFAPWGLASRPVVGVLAGLVKAVAGAFNGMVFGVTTDKYGPQDLADGETALYNKVQDCLIKLLESGDISIEASSGQDVTVNGGSAKVSRVGDNLTASTVFLTWAAAVDAGIATNTPPPTPFATAAGLTGGMGTINQGAANFKA